MDQANELKRSEIHSLLTDLRAHVRGDVRFDEGSRALYATDASNYRQVPIGVVIPRDVDDVLQTLAAARRHGAPVVPRGGGTSLAGEACNVALVIDLSKYMNRVLMLDPASRRARVEPGTVLDDLRDQAKEHGLTFGPDPSTHDHNTLGGMIGNNSCGTHSLMSGCTIDNIEELDVVTYDGVRMRVGPTSEDELQRIIEGGGRRGEIYGALRSLRDRYADEIRRRYPYIPRRVSGYNLDALLPEHGFNLARALVGTEGSCVTVLEATTRLVESPPGRTIVILGFSDVNVAADHVPLVLEYHPIALEGIDQALVDNMVKKGMNRTDLDCLPAGHGWLIAEFGAETAAEADARAQEMIDGVVNRAEQRPSSNLIDDRRQERQVWELRESGLAATARVPGEEDTWEGWEDSAVQPERLGDYLRGLEGLYKKYGYHGSLYGHFGQGCVHTRINFDLVTARGIARFRAFMQDAADLVLAHGGSLSGEHGDGQARAELLPKMFGDELVQAFREFKRIWDPDLKMNPHKVVDPYRMDENLRLGVHYRPPAASTVFQFPADEGSFARATLRCVGVGECRRTHFDEVGESMCPSYLVTREEQHSTRGRARLLFEMLQGDPLTRGWRDESVRAALDLCLACKGCKSDCPVGVDMATYKAEFLSHYYQGRLRPLSAYSLGLIYWWARVASHAPRLVNAVLRTRGVSRLAKLLAGVSGERELPAFAAQTFKRWLASQPVPAAGGRKVILWADTFNNHFHPDTLRSAQRVLEDAGFSVATPRASLCCGRPLYDYGMLDTAKGLLRQVLQELREDIAAGTPVVGVEPTCVAVFRDELGNLFPHDQDARRLRSQVFTLTEFLHQEGYTPPTLGRRAVVHGHCHEKAIVGLDGERAMLDALGMDYELLASGCCGMAGSFGFERDHYDLSVAVGERALLPAVRALDDETLIITNGFSCREQVAQLTGRTALTTADVLAMALTERASAAAATTANDGRAS